MASNAVLWCCKLPLRACNGMARCVGITVTNVSKVGSSDDTAGDEQGLEEDIDATAERPPLLLRMDRRSCRDTDLAHINTH